MLKNNLIQSIIAMLLGAFLIWIGSQAFTIKGDQRDLQARVTGVEKNTEHIRDRVDDIYTILAQKNKVPTVIVDNKLEEQ
jgi:hypothetical protein